MTVHILCGPRGCGKSELADTLDPSQENIYCVDDCLQDILDANFQFGEAEEDQQRIAAADCFYDFIVDGLKRSSDSDVLVVDGINSSVAEIAPYYQAAKSFGHDVKIHIFVGNDPNVLRKWFERNTHDRSHEKFNFIVQRIWNLLYAIPREWDAEVLYVREHVK